jgi:hypothetical protein
MEQQGTALLLVAGITVFVLGEVEVSPTFNVIGIGLILVSVTHLALHAITPSTIYTHPSHPLVTHPLENWCPARFSLTCAMPRVGRCLL